MICAAVFPRQSVEGFGWVTFVCVSGLVQSAISFIIHIINYFPDQTLAYLIVRILLYFMCTVGIVLTVIIRFCQSDRTIKPKRLKIKSPNLAQG